MGEVFLGHDLRLDRRVAIKFLLDSDAGDPDARRRLLREARAAAALNHPNICAVYEVGQDADGRDFIAMQYVEGDTLATRLSRGALSVQAALALIAGVVDALHEAHRRGVIHRDLKPQNIIVTPSGAPCLLDFGIARRERPIDDAGARSTTTHVESGTLAGTPAYMAPELMQGEPPDPRSDLFSLGVVLYECLTGRQPFQGGTPLQVSARILHVTPDAPSLVNASVPTYVDALCARLLEKNPADRFQTAAEVRGALTTALPRPLPGPAVRTSGSRRRLVVLAGLLTAAGLWGYLSFARGNLPAPPSEAAGWYQRGIEALREGSYTSARRSLEEAVRLSSTYAMAHARLAEALTELDDEGGAQAALLRVSALVPDQSRLADVDRLHLDAIRATVLRDYDAAIAAYQRLAALNDDDAGAVADLGRAQESAGRLSDARASYQRATTVDRQFASGFLRLGVVEGASGKVDAALAAFSEAERLYGAASNIEGRVETLLRRGRTLDAAGRSAETAEVADRAGRLARETGLVAQEVRAGFLLGSARIGSGTFVDGERVMNEALAKAVSAGLEGIAADGLIDIAGALLTSGRVAEADGALIRAREIADRRLLKRTAMRATTQRAALRQQERQPREALALLDEPMRYFVETKNRRLESVANVIAARAHLDLSEFEQARPIAEQALAFAIESHNGELEALAHTTLSNAAYALGDLPGALRHRLESERVLRSTGDQETLPYDVAVSAELLIRLGRTQEAVDRLNELDAGITKGLGAYQTRARRVLALRALLAAVESRHEDVLRFTSGIDVAPSRAADETSLLGRMLASVARARLGVRGEVPVVEGDASAFASRELALWRATALIAQGRVDVAALELDALVRVATSVGGVEQEWRACALAAIAWASRDPSRAQAMAARSIRSLSRLTETWADAAPPYRQRADLRVLEDRLRSIWTQPSSGGTR